MPWKVFKEKCELVTVQMLLKELNTTIFRLPEVSQVFGRQFTNIRHLMMIRAQNNDVRQEILTAIAYGQNVMAITGAFIPATNRAFWRHVSSHSHTQIRAQICPLPIGMLLAAHLAELRLTSAGSAAIFVRSFTAVIPEHLAAYVAFFLDAAFRVPMAILRASRITVAASVTAIDTMCYFARPTPTKNLLPAGATVNIWNRIYYAFHHSPDKLTAGICIISMPLQTYKGTVALGPLALGV